VKRRLTATEADEEHGPRGRRHKKTAATMKFTYSLKYSLCESDTWWGVAQARARRTARARARRERNMCAAFEKGTPHRNLEHETSKSHVARHIHAHLPACSRRRSKAERPWVFEALGAASGVGTASRSMRVKEGE
jgi:hypothetical protein